MDSYVERRHTVGFEETNPAGTGGETLVPQGMHRVAHMHGPNGREGS